ncbi:GtrA family protein [Xanthomonas sp. WHRI 10064A]|uniref:GtrA family protein n=1 Tax=unclassified Xanthomonas TaxID=2643310 RepID=UPI002B22E67C|nr:MULTISPECIES: GtrA family protein [unclassified Xanthomonas]MEA9587218.1 GtrA family protein [Xanthomonas sp. WHRI 10064B]MEA9616409.1 GtrA family protein [Xanthomonas sp. WHRI 10064A]
MRALQWTRKLIAKSSLVRFLISGGLNTAVTYATYLALLQITTYKAAYTLSYISGIIIAFLINRLFVFRTHRGWRSLLMFPFVYLAQYLTSLFLVTAWVEHFGFKPAFAPLAAITVTIPLTFVLSRAVFGWRNSAK